MGKPVIRQISVKINRRSEASGVLVVGHTNPYERFPTDQKDLAVRNLGAVLGSQGTTWMLLLWGVNIISSRP
jgi:hypothetical protein